jgi:hypothetical protein
MRPITRPLRSVRPFRFDRRWVFEVPPDELWRVLSRTDQFPTWWKWLRRFDSDGLVEGGESRCVIRGALPYSLSFAVRVVELQPPSLVRADVSGDLAGPARLEIEPHPDGSTARLVWEVDLRSPILRPMVRVARPLMEWGHDWVVDTGIRQFERHALP